MTITCYVESRTPDGPKSAAEAGTGANRRLRPGREGADSAGRQRRQAREGERAHHQTRILNGGRSAVKVLLAQPAP